MVIQNAKDTPLNQQTGAVPNVNNALRNWFQPMIFGVVTKEVENSQVVEAMTEVNFLGVIQPLSARDLMIKPEGERDWKWYRVHADPSLVLDPDSVIKYLGEQYRVKANWDYKIYGFVEYHLVKDYEGSGPEVAAP